MLRHGSNEVVLAVLDLHVALVLHSLEEAVERLGPVLVVLRSRHACSLLVLRLLNVPENVFGDLVKNALSLSLLKVVLVSLCQVFHKAVVFILQEVVEVLLKLGLKMSILKNFSIFTVKSESKSSLFRIVFSVKFDSLFVILRELFEESFQSLFVSLLDFCVLDGVLSSSILKDLRLLPGIEDLLQERASFVPDKSSSGEHFFRSISVVLI